MYSQYYNKEQKTKINNTQMNIFILFLKLDHNRKKKKNVESTCVNINNT